MQGMSRANKDILLVLRPENLDKSLRRVKNLLGLDTESHPESRLDTESPLEEAPELTQFHETWEVPRCTLMSTLSMEKRRV